MGLQYECAEKLISMVHERRPIWDFKDPNYHNRDSRKVLWAEICNELNANLDDVYRRWKSLKDTFVREYKKEKLYGRKNKWIYYESLMFLKDRFKYQESDTNEPNEHDYFGILETGAQVEVGDSTDNTDQENRATPRPLKKQKTKGRASSIRTTGTGGQSTVNCNCNESEELDPDYYFLMSLLPYMKNIKPERKMDVRTKLQKVFQEEQQLQSQQQCSSTSSTGPFQGVATSSNKRQSELSSYISSFTIDESK